MARDTGWRLIACQDYLRRRRRLSLDAAIELAGRHDELLAALLLRVQEVRERHAAAARGGQAAAKSEGFARAVSAEPRA